MTVVSDTIGPYPPNFTVQEPEQQKTKERRRRKKIKVGD